jgi:hypothetical protein
MKTILKLIVAALVLHATWKAGTVYLRYFEFKDEVAQIAQFGTQKSDAQMRDEVLDAARRREIPLTPGAVTVSRPNDRIVIDANYKEQVELVPRYFYPWDAKVHVDVLTLVLRQAK